MKGPKPKIPKEGRPGYRWWRQGWTLKTPKRIQRRIDRSRKKKKGMK